MLAALVLPSPESAATRVSWASVASNSTPRWEVDGDVRTTCRGDRDVGGGFEELDEDYRVSSASVALFTGKDLVVLSRLWRGYLPLLDSMSWQSAPAESQLRHGTPFGAKHLILRALHRRHAMAVRTGMVESEDRGRGGLVAKAAS